MNEILVVVDAQKDFVSGALGSQAAVDALPHLCEVIKDSRYKAIFVTLDTHDAEAYSQTLEGKLLPVPHTILNTDGWKLEDAVEEALLDTSFLTPVTKMTKPTFGAIHIVHPILDAIVWKGNNASLMAYKEANWSEQDDVCNSADLSITIVGFCTDICVVSNALLLRAYFPNAPIRVIAKACAGTSPEKHEAALAVMESCQIEVVR